MKPEISCFVASFYYLRKNSLLIHITQHNKQSLKFIHIVRNFSNFFLTQSKEEAAAAAVEIKKDEFK